MILRAIIPTVAASLLIGGLGIGPAWTTSSFNYPWCAHYVMQNGPQNCGFTTLSQCWQSVSGVGGFCNANPAHVPTKTSAAKRKRAG